MVTSNTGQKCVMVQLYCSEQIAIPETFPNILKTFAKAAIRTQPYDILRWSAAYFRCLANDQPPPAKIRLERECRQRGLTKGYLKVLIAQVGKGFFISRCLLQERWKALCLPEEDLLKYLSLCRMLNWPQIHWLKVLAVMVGSLNESPHESMVMVCELLTDDTEGGMARIPYWMFKICYTFLASLDCTQEQCFVNGQLVLPWGDLEEPRPMDSLPRVLSATLLKDTIISSCKAKFNKPHRKECTCPLESDSGTASTDFMMNFELGDPKELLTNLEDFDTIMLLLQDSQRPELTEEDIIAPHSVTEKQMKRATKLADKYTQQRQEQVDQIEKNAREYLEHEAYQMLREVGPPWTWLHQFTTTNCNTASYNFIEHGSIGSDATPDDMSAESFDLIKEEPNVDKDKSSSTSCIFSDTEGAAEKKYSLDSLKTALEEAKKNNLCDIEHASSVIDFLKAEELRVLQRSGQPTSAEVNLKDVVSALEQAEEHGLKFKDVDHLMHHVKATLLGDITDFPTVSFKPQPKPQEPSLSDYQMYEPTKDLQPIPIPEDWQETIPKQVVVPPRTKVETEPEPEKEEKLAAPKEDITQIFESTVPVPPELTAKMPKFCFAKKDEDELILGLVPLIDPVEEVEEEEIGSPISESGPQSLKGYRSDDSTIFPEEKETARSVVARSDKDFYCCLNAATLTPRSYQPPPPTYKCTVSPFPGIGPVVTQKTINDFLTYLRIRARSQRGLIHPRNFKEEKCPYMVDTTT